jgi:hypothetical protein
MTRFNAISGVEVKLRGRPGAEIDRAALDAATLASSLACSVTFVFNDQEIFVGFERGFRMMRSMLSRGITRSCPRPSIPPP